MRRTAMGHLLGILAAAPVAALAAAPHDAIPVSTAQRTTAGIDSTPVTAAGLGSVGTLPYIGRIEYAEAGPVAIISPSQGRVTGVYARPGERIRAGAAVMTITGPEVQGARHALQSATAAADAAVRHRDRDAELLAIGAISQARFEASTTQAREAESALASARAVIGSGSFRTDGTLQLLAPVAGHVLGPALAPGDAVAAGQVLAYVSDAPALHASFTVPPASARALAQDDAVVTSSAACEVPGRIHAVARNIDAESQSVVVHASLDGAPCFLPGESVTIRVAPAAASQAGFALPPSAFVTIGPKTYVFRDAGTSVVAVEVDAIAARAGFARAASIVEGTRIVTRKKSSA